MLRKDWPDGTIELNCCYEHKLVYVKLVAKLKLKKQKKNNLHCQQEWLIHVKM